MRKSIMGAAMSMAVIAMGGIGAAADTKPNTNKRRSARYRPRMPKTSFDSKINRWTGQSHLHEREIARRERQRTARLNKAHQSLG